MSTGTITLHETGAPQCRGLGSGSKTRLLGGSAGSADSTQPCAPSSEAHPLLSSALKLGTPVHVVVRGRCPNLPLSDCLYSAAPGGVSHYAERAVFTGTLVAFDTRGSLALADAQECGWRLEPLCPLPGESLPPAAPEFTPPFTPIPAAALISQTRAHGTHRLPLKRPFREEGLPLCPTPGDNADACGPPGGLGAAAEGDALRARRERAAADALEERRRAAAAEEPDSGEDERAAGEDETPARVGDSALLSAVPQGLAVWVVRSRTLGHVVLRCSAVTSISVGLDARPHGMGPPLDKRVRGRSSDQGVTLLHGGAQVWPIVSPAAPQ